MDERLLREEMEKKGLKILDMCEALNMSRTAFYRKCKGITEFTLGEIQRIIEILQLEDPMDIFFPPKVS